MKRFVVAYLLGLATMAPVAYYYRADDKDASQAFNLCLNLYTKANDDCEADLMQSRKLFHDEARLMRGELDPWTLEARR